MSMEFRRFLERARAVGGRRAGADAGPAFGLGPAFARDAREAAPHLSAYGELWHREFEHQVEERGGLEHRLDEPACADLRALMERRTSLLINGDFGPDYFAAVEEIGLFFRYRGLPPALVAAGYARFCRKINGLVVDAGEGGETEQIVSVLNAFSSVVMLELGEVLAAMCADGPAAPPGVMGVEAMVGEWGPLCRP